MTTDFIKINLSSDGNLVIEKSGPVKYGEILLYLLLPVVLIIGPPLYILFTAGFKLPEGWFTTFTLLSIVATGIWMSWITINRSVQLNRSIIVSESQGNIFINGRYFCRNEDLDPVVIQTFPSGEKGKFYYNIGLASGRKFAPLLFRKDHKTAQAAQNLLIQYFAGKMSKEERNLELVISN